MHSNEISTELQLLRYTINLYCYLESYASKIDSRGSCGQEKKDKLFEQAACFPIFREYWRYLFLNMQIVNKTHAVFINNKP